MKIKKGKKKKEVLIQNSCEHADNKKDDLLVKVLSVWRSSEPNHVVFEGNVFTF